MSTFPKQVSFLPLIYHMREPNNSTLNLGLNVDGGQEVISTRFVHPSAILREFHDGKITLLPPQFYLLTTLVDVLQGVSNTEKQRMRVEHISRSNFGRMTFNPRPLKTEGEDRVQGQLILTYEGDETRGGSPGRLHRANLRMADGVSTE